MLSICKALHATPVHSGPQHFAGHSTLPWYVPHKSSHHRGFTKHLSKPQGTEGGAFQWGLSNASETWERAHVWPQDSMWTESNWPPGGIPQLQLYQVGRHMSHTILDSLTHPSNYVHITT